MKLVANNLNDQAYRALKDGIINKEITPGTRLVDTQLAEQFGISRTPIRDAIRKLAEEGLVVNQRKGYTVFRPSEADIREIFELRLIFDLAAAERLIFDILPGNEEALELLRRSYEGTLSSDEPSFVSIDEGFHQTMIRLTGNRRLLDLYYDVGTQTRAFRRITSSDPVRMKKAAEYHKKIYEGLVAFDYDATVEAIRRHVDFSLKDALHDFGSTAD